MSYKKGRDFEYKIIKKLNELNINCIRNELSRKPDLWTEYGLFEIKKTVKKGKIKCFVLDFEDYLKNKIEKAKIESLDLKDIFYTLTIKDKKLILIIPFYLDLNYVKQIKENIETLTKKLIYYLYFIKGNIFKNMCK